MTNAKEPVRARDGGPLPLFFRWLLGQGVADLPPWRFLYDQQEADGLGEEFRREVVSPNPCDVRDLAIFARREDCDTCAGFVVVDGGVTEEVCTVHLTWTGKPERPGFPVMERYPSFFAWLTRDAFVAKREWASKTALADRDSEGAP